MKMLIVGAGPQALFLLRTLARAGHMVTVLAFENKVAGFSKYGVKVISKDLSQFTSHLENLAYAADKTFLCGGKELQFILDKVPNLFELTDVYPKPYGAVKIFSDKLATYKYMESFGLKSPQSYSFEQLEKLSTLPRALIAKWNQELPASLTPEFKTKIFICLDELTAFISELEPNVRQFIVFQDFIEGDDANNISMQIALNEQALKGHLIAKKLRVSKNGYTSYIEEIETNDDLKRQILKPVFNAFLELDYSGFAEIEFKICPATGVYYLIEVNPRPCGLVSALSGKYSGIHAFLEGGGLHEIALRENVRWSNILRDIQTSLFNFKIHKSLPRALKELNSIRKANSYDIFDLTDLKPFFSQLIP